MNTCSEGRSKSTAHASESMNNCIAFFSRCAYSDSKNWVREPHANASTNDSPDIYSFDNIDYEANGDSTDIHSVDIINYE